MRNALVVTLSLSALYLQACGQNESQVSTTSQATVPAAQKLQALIGTWQGQAEWLSGREACILKISQGEAGGELLVQVEQKVKSSGENIVHKYSSAVAVAEEQNGVFNLRQEKPYLTELRLTGITSSTIGKLQSDALELILTGTSAGCKNLKKIK